MSNLVEKWSEIGLLKDLPNYKKVIAANLYEDMSKYVFNLNQNSSYTYTTTTIILPTIYRIVNGGGHIKDVGDLFRDVNNFVNKHKESLEKSFTLHVEAQLVTKYTDYYLNQKNNEI